MEKQSRVSCIYDAINKDIIHGDFTPDKKTFKFPIIPTTDCRGNESTWQVSVSPFDTEKDKTVSFKRYMLESPVTQLAFNIVGKIHVTNITHTGKERAVNDTIVDKGRNIEKTNATTSVGQAIIMANRMYNDKSKKSTHGIVDVKPLPMLLKKYGSSKKAIIPPGQEFIVEGKFDGVRSISHILHEDDSVELYSRAGHRYIGLTHIEQDIAKMLHSQTIYNITDIYIDGELYMHGAKLQDISGAVRSEGKPTGKVKRENLKLHVYDLFVISEPDLPQIERKKLLDQLFKTGTYDSLELVHYDTVSSMDEANVLYDKYLKDGYEGIVIRKLNCPYQHSVNNYHSDHILKRKPVESDEFEIVGYTQGKGKDLGSVTFKLQTTTGKKFNAVPNMTQEDRKYLFKRFGEDSEEDEDITMFDALVKGQMATIQYAVLSAAGAPTQPKFIAIRNYENGGVDPISELLSERD
jgi:ATP-dependent DNA ligase